MQSSGFSQEDYKVFRRETSYSGFFKVESIQVQHKLFAGSWSSPITRELLSRGETVGVLPYDPIADTVVLVEQFRIGALDRARSPWLLELVAGIIERDESPQEVASREAIEEANCRVTDLLPLAEYFPSPGACSEYIKLFCGKTVTEGLGGIHGCDSEGEDIKVHVMPRETAYKHLSLGDIVEAHTIIALQWLQLNYQRLQQSWR